ncbi:vesicle-associated membrane protein-associated protein B [Pseudohyphozyma bogoriensis]|nr:vesicle-associated membrane protein-associated protein B [Pseudohyphozyma bogoriensis]
MSVSLSPSGQLGFQRPLTQLVKRTLAVSNSNSQPVAFKVKTTAPKQYCVRPNSGRIEPGETVEVQVLLQPMKEDPAPGAKCRDKFLVQSVIITPEREANSLPELWAIVEKEDKAGDKEVASIHEQKIRCTYLAAAEDGAAAAPASPAGAQSPATNGAPSQIDDESKFDTVRPTSTNGTSALPSAASAFSSPPTTSSPSVPAQKEVTPTSTPPQSSTPPPPSYATPSNVSTTVQEKARDAAIGAAGIAAAGATAVGLDNVADSISSAAQKVEKSAPAPAPPASTDPAVLASQLAAAQAEIAKLKEQLKQSDSVAAGLRSRGVGVGKDGTPVSSGGSVPGTAQAVVEVQGQQMEGVPLQVVAGIAFGVFVVTWLFF